MSSHIHRPTPGMGEAVDYLSAGADEGLVTTDTVVYITVLFATGALLFLLVYFVSLTLLYVKI